MKPVFVYGTLKSDIPVKYEMLEKSNWNFLKRKKASINGNMYVIPIFESKSAYPAICELETENIVYGELVYIDDPLFWYKLDLIEGNMYDRVITKTTDGEECWVYQWNYDKIETMILIEHGNFQNINVYTESGPLTIIPLSYDKNIYKAYVPMFCKTFNIDFDKQEMICIE